MIRRDGIHCTIKFSSNIKEKFKNISTLSLLNLSLFPTSSRKINVENRWGSWGHIHVQIITNKKISNRGDFSKNKEYLLTLFLNQFLKLRVLTSWPFNHFRYWSWGFYVFVNMLPSLLQNQSIDFPLPIQLCKMRW